MEDSVKDLIRERAEILFPILRDQLFEGEGSSEFGEAFKFVFLLIRFPQAYFESFKEGVLLIDSDMVNEIYCQYRQEIPGVNGLLNEEHEIIAEHNHQVENYLKQEGLRRPGLRVVQQTLLSRQFG